MIIATKIYQHSALDNDSVVAFVEEFDGQYGPVLVIGYVCHLVGKGDYVSSCSFAFELAWVSFVQFLNGNDVLLPIQ